MKQSKLVARRGKCGGKWHDFWSWWRAIGPPAWEWWPLAVSGVSSKKRRNDARVLRAVEVARGAAGVAKAGKGAFCDNRHCTYIYVQNAPARSDLDFLATFQELNLDQYADTYFGLPEYPHALFQRPVDLVVASAIENPYFRQAVDFTKNACLYEFLRRWRSGSPGASHFGRDGYSPN